MEHNNRNYSSRYQDYGSSQNQHRTSNARRMSKNNRRDEGSQYSSDEGHTPYRGREGHESSSSSYGYGQRGASSSTGGWNQSSQNRNRDNDRNYDVNYSHNYDRDNYSSSRPTDYRSSYDYMSYGQGMDDNNMNRYSYDSDRSYGGSNYQSGGYGSAYGSSYGSGSNYQTPDYGSSYTSGSGSGRNYSSSDESYGAGSNYGSGTNYGSGSNFGTGSSFGSSSYGTTSGSNYGDMDRSSSSSSNRISYSGKGPKGWQRSDENIRERVCDMLERDHGVDASEIEVTVKEGMVTLSGKVDQRSSKRRAEDIIENIPGVKDVKNEITVDKSLFQQAKEMFTGESSSSDKSSNRMAKSTRH